MPLAKTGHVLEKPWKIRSGLSIATPQMVHKGRFYLFSERVKGGADVPAMCGQVLVGLLVGAAVQGGEHAGGTGAELFVGSVEVDHEVALNLAKADHGAAGDEVKGELGGGAGLEAGGAGDEFGPGGEIDFDISGGPLAMARGIAGQKDRSGAEITSLFQGAVDEGGVAGGGDAANNILIVHTAIGDGDGTGRGAVFGAFDGAVEGLMAAGDDSLNEIGGGAEGGWDLAGIENSQAAAGSGAYVKKAASLFKICVNEIDGGFELSLAVGKGVGDGFLVFDEECDEGGGVEFVEVGGSGVSLFCLGGSEVLDAVGCWLVRCRFRGGEGSLGGDEGCAVGSRAAANLDLGVGCVAGEVFFEEIDVFGLMGKNAALQANWGMLEVESAGHHSSVFGEAAGTDVEDDVNLGARDFGGLEDEGGELADRRLIGFLSPKNKVVEGVETEFA